jgi:hypothetical protein
MNSHLLASVLLVLPVAAQTFSVVPSKAATSQEGKWYSVYLFYGSTSNSASHTQCLYDTSDVTTVAGLLNGVAVRRNNYLGGSQAASNVNVTIDVSVSPVAHNAASTTYANNHGPNRAQVFNGPVSLPARTMGAWPEPWESTIAFTAPLAYARPMGSSLVVDFSVNGGTSVWYADACAIGYGQATTDVFQSNCRSSEGGSSGGYGYFTFQPYPGGPFTLNISGYPSNVPTLASSRMFFGLVGRGGMLGPFTLPVPFATLGIPAPANCALSIAPIVDVPVTYRTGTQPNQGSLNLASFNMPNDPSLSGQSFFTQAIGIDRNPVTMAPELFPSISIKWTFGTGNPVPATMVTRLADTNPPSPTGGVVQSQAPVLQLRFQ